MRSDDMYVMKSKGAKDIEAFACTELSARGWMPGIAGWADNYISEDPEHYVLCIACQHSTCTDEPSLDIEIPFSRTAIANYEQGIDVDVIKAKITRYILAQT